MVFQEAGATVEIAVNGYAIGAFVGYLILLLAIGVYSARFSSAGIGEFFVGGRRMNRLVVALSAVVSGRSAWLLLGVTGMAYVAGASAVWAITGSTIAEFVLFLTYAGRLRRFSESYDCITLPDFFAARFGDDKGWLRLTLALIILLFMVGYVSAQFVGGGKAMSASFGLTFGQGVLITALIVLGYTMMGGFLAVSLTDTFQAFIMILGLVILPVVAITAAGGWGAVAAEVTAYQPGFVNPFALTLAVFIGHIGIGLGSPGNPHILVRYMSIKDPAQLKYAAVVGTLWNAVMGVGAVLVGISGRVFFPDAGMLPSADPENLYPVLAQQQLHPLLFGVVVASIFAAIMSTADSQLLVAASSLVRDFYQKVVRRDRPVDQKRLVAYSRAVVLILVVIAVLLGVTADELVFWLVLFAWAGLGAAIGPTSILALYWRRTTRSGIFAGLLVGSVTTIVWGLTPALKSRLYELVPAFGLALLATVVVSWLTRPPADVDELFDSMK